MVITHKIDNDKIKSIITDTVFMTSVLETWRQEDTDDRVTLELAKWRYSDAGKFVLERVTDTPSFYTQRNAMTFSIEIAVVASMEQKHFSEFLLKWGKNGSNTR
jgi:hypothetical protein